MEAPFTIDYEANAQPTENSTSDLFDRTFIASRLDLIRDAIENLLKWNKKYENNQLHPELTLKLWFTDHERQAIFTFKISKVKKNEQAISILFSGEGGPIGYIHIPPYETVSILGSKKMPLEIVPLDPQASFYPYALMDSKVNGEMRPIAQFMQKQDAEKFKAIKQPSKLRTLFSLLLLGTKIVRNEIHKPKETC